MVLREPKIGCHHYCSKWIYNYWEELHKIFFESLVVDHIISFDELTNVWILDYSEIPKSQDAFSYCSVDLQYYLRLFDHKSMR